MLSRIMLCSVLFACLSSPLAAQSPFLNPRLFVSPSIPASLATVNLRINDQTGLVAVVEDQSIQASGFQIEVRASVKLGNAFVMAFYELNYALPALPAGLYTVTYIARTRSLEGTYGPYFTERVWRFLVNDPGSDRVAVEYVNAARQHYFTTALANEIAALDAGVFAGWTRTGESMRVLAAGNAGAEQPVFCNWSSVDLFGVVNQAFMAR